MDSECGWRRTALPGTMSQYKVTCPQPLCHRAKRNGWPSPPREPVPNTQNRNLSPTQEHALTLYRRLTDKNDGNPPSVREFAAALGKSHNAAHYLIGKLREKGFLSMKPITIIRPNLTAKGRAAKGSRAQ